ncbi:MAG: methylenetetrahydrofolate reductase C-terminal domain-containing protein [Oscillospiraceae bacterium]|jgi:electron transport complex protein RnfC|nr:methylenetetrahydrofolate reductase C-terminal domain-containing protein [Oscillospiraceae bacterium]
MLITELKSTETLRQQIKGKVFVLNCHGCREIRFPEHEADAFQAELTAEGIVTGIFTTEYICNDENLAVILKPHAAAIEAAETIAVFSCGVGVQTVAAMYPGKRVVACCDTYALPGYQGVTPLEVDCKQCGECFLNLTGGICPLTACSKSLVNGQCGGAKNGKCEVDPNMECGWERIYQKLKKIGRLDAMKCPVQIRNYATDDQAKV